MADQTLKPGKILHVNEIIQKGLSIRGQSVRVMGRLESESGCTNISYNGQKLAVDVSKILGTTLRDGSLFQLIGEMDSEYTEGQQELVLRARVARNVDGLDEQLYLQVLEMRRKFEAGTHADLMR